MRIGRVLPAFDCSINAGTESGRQLSERFRGGDGNGVRQSFVQNQRDVRPERFTGSSQDVQQLPGYRLLLRLKSTIR